MKFQLGDLLLAQLRKDKFPKGEYNKLKLKKIRPCKILRKFFANAYEIEMLKDAGISPIFNVVDLYKYHAGEISEATNDNKGEQHACYDPAYTTQK